MLCKKVTAMKTGIQMLSAKLLSYLVDKQYNMGDEIISCPLYRFKYAKETKSILHQGLLLEIQSFGSLEASDYEEGGGEN